MNSVVLIGRLTADPELRFIPSKSMANASFILAIDKGYTKEKKQDMISKGKTIADFVRVKVYGKQAENCSHYLTKGKLAAASGSLITYSYKGNDGVVRYVTEVIANRVEFLEWGESRGRSESDEFSFGGASFEDFKEIDDDGDGLF